MGLFNRHKEIPKLEHEHIWKDMPWYLDVYYNTSNKIAGYEIIEPYICITCGERKNVSLEKENYTNISVSEREAIFKEVRQKYKRYLKPRAVVEDMIHNILLVKDPSRLEMIETARGTPHRKCGTSAEMVEILKKPEYQIKIEVPKEQ